MKFIFMALQKSASERQSLVWVGETVTALCGLQDGPVFFRETGLIGKHFSCGQIEIPIVLGLSTVLLHWKSPGYVAAE